MISCTKLQQSIFNFEMIVPKIFGCFLFLMYVQLQNACNLYHFHDSILFKNIQVYFYALGKFKSEIIWILFFLIFHILFSITDVLLKYIVATFHINKERKIWMILFPTIFVQTSIEVERPRLYKLRNIEKYSFVF